MHIGRVTVLVKGCLYVLYSISASGDLLKKPVIQFFQYWMNDCINHACISVLLSQMFPPKFVQITDLSVDCPHVRLLSLGISS